MITPRGWSGISKYIASSSAMNPSLLVILMVTVPALAFSYFSRPPYSIFFMIMAAAPVMVALWQIQKFTRGDTSQLRNDKHVEKMAELRLGSNEPGNEFEISIKPNSVLIDNPKLSDGEGK